MELFGGVEKNLIMWFFLGVTMGYNGLQWVTMGCNGLQWVTRGYKGC